MYAIFELSACSKKRLLQDFPPSLPVVLCDHVTLYDGEDDDGKRKQLLYDFASDWEVIGLARSPDVVALVVAHRGTTVRELYDGATFHCTHSLAPGHDAHESNDVIAMHGWTLLPAPIPIKGTVRLR